MRWCRGWAVALIAPTLSFAAFAQVDASVAADTDYRYRGVSLSDSRPSVRLTVNDDISSAWYAGASATRVAPGSGEHYVQLLGYAGWVSPVVDRRRIEVGVGASHFSGSATLDFIEPYVGLLAEQWTARIHFAPDYFGQHVQTVYTALEGHVPLGVQARLFGHVGVLMPLHGAVGEANTSRGDVQLGAAVVWNRVDLRIAWVGATRNGPYPALANGRSNAVVAGISASF